MVQCVNDLGIHHNRDKSQRDQKPEIIPIIPPSNTHPNPGTVMIKPLHTNITNRAVRSARGPIDIASITELNLKMMGFNPY